MDTFENLDATAQAALVRQKEVTPLELVEAAIARIEERNPALNCVIDKFYDDARTAANAPLRDGPFIGVPFLVKDLVATVAGKRHTAGSAFQNDFVTPHDSELVRRHRQAGLVILGKTNTPEYGILPTTESRFLGACRNPWDRGRTTGGSSGGSAAAVAAGIVPMAHAGDGGGSIRIPAACCGVFGLKPTRGRNPLGPLLGELFHGFLAEHAVTRTVRDSAALLDATSTPPDVGDPYYAPAPTRPYREEVGAPPGRLRIAFMSKRGTRAPIAAECLKGLEETVALCRELGHELVEKNPETDGGATSQAFITVWAGGNGWKVADAARAQKKTPREEDFEPLTWALYQLAKTVDAPAYLTALTALQLAAREVQKEYHAFDVILTPTLAESPPPLGTFVEPPGMPMAALLRATEFTPFTPLANMTGQPAMSVPLCWSAAGLPVGMHFIGRYGDEATLFRLAAQLEEARPWAKCQPTLGKSGTE